MNAKVYVDNLAGAATESELRDLFSAYGNVVDVNIAADRATQKSRGFGIVTMATPEGARAAIQGLNGKAIGTESLIVSGARPNEERAASSNGRQPRRRASHFY